MRSRIHAIQSPLLYSKVLPSTATISLPGGISCHRFICLRTKQTNGTVVFHAAKWVIDQQGRVTRLQQQVRLKELWQ